MTKTAEQPQVLACPGCGQQVLHVQLPGGRGLLVERTEVLDDAPDAPAYVAVSEAGDARAIGDPGEAEAGEAVHVPHVRCAVVV